MANPLRSFDLLLRMKRRRIDQYEETAAAQAQQVKACEEEHAQAMQAEENCRNDEQACTDKILSLLSDERGFRPNQLITMRHVLETLADKTRKAASETQQAAQRVQAAMDELHETRRQIRRAEQQLEQLEERRKKMAQELELAQEDVQDEESEEAAVARLIAASREAQLLLDTEGI